MNKMKTLPALLAATTLAAVAAPTTATAQWLAGDDIAAPTVVEPPTCNCPASAYAYALAYGYAASAYEEPGYAAPAYGFAAPACGGPVYAAPAYGYAAPAYEEPVYAVRAYEEPPDYAAYGYGRRVFAHAPSAYGNARRGFASARPSPGLRPAVAALLPRGSSPGLRPRVAASLPRGRSPGLRPTATVPGARANNFTPGLRTASRSRPSAGVPVASLWRSSE